MENNSGDTQARFLAKSLAFLAISSQQTAFGQRELTANEKDGHHRFAQMNADTRESIHCARGSRSPKTFALESAADEDHRNHRHESKIVRILRRTVKRSYAAQPSAVWP